MGKVKRNSEGRFVKGSGSPRSFDLDIDRAKELYSELNTTHLVAKEMGVSQGKVYNTLKPLGVLRDKSQSNVGKIPWNKSNLDERAVIDKYKENHSSIKTAKAFNVSKPVILKILKKNNIERTGTCDGNAPWNKGKKTNLVIVECCMCGCNIERDRHRVNEKKSGMFVCKKSECISKFRSEVASKNPIFYNTGKDHPGYIHGKCQEPYPAKWNRSFKRKIVERDGGRCQMCGKHESEESREMAVHHINYEKSDLEPFNLITLCPSCHGKTNRNRDYWFDELTDVQTFNLIGEYQNVS